MKKWKDVEGYEGLYQVSDEGEVKSLKYRGSNKEYILSNRKVTKGYMQVILWKNRKSKTFMVHRLVAQAFIPNPNNYPQINHKDEDKTNNKVENLEWCTNEYNHNYGTGNIRRGGGLNHAGSKRVYQYTLNGELIAIWPSSMECGRNGFSQCCISNCCNGKLETYKGYRWSYEA